MKNTGLETLAKRNPPRFFAKPLPENIQHEDSF